MCGYGYSYFNLLTLITYTKIVSEQNFKIGANSHARITSALRGEGAFRILTFTDKREKVSIVMTSAILALTVLSTFYQMST